MPSSSNSFTSVCFGVSRRRLGEVLFRPDAIQPQRLSFAHLRQRVAFGLRHFFVVFAVGIRRCS